METPDANTKSRFRLGSSFDSVFRYSLHDAGEPGTARAVSERFIETLDYSTELTRN